jgi:hypothetical protein
MWETRGVFQAQRLFHRSLQAAAVAAVMQQRSPLESTAQAMRASLLAIATTTTLLAARISSPRIHCRHSMFLRWKAM